MLYLDIDVKLRSIYTSIGLRGLRSKRCNSELSIRICRIIFAKLRSARLLIVGCSHSNPINCLTSLIDKFQVNVTFGKPDIYNVASKLLENKYLKA